jgi:hypothetical protein
MTRTHNKHIRAYVDGVDVSGYTRAVGTLGWVFDAEPDAAVTDEVKNILIGKCDIQAGAISAFLDNDTAGLFVLAGNDVADHGTRNIMVAIGANAAPVQGDNVFAWKFEQTSYQMEQGSGFVAVSIPLGGASSQSTLTYKKPWGKLLHAKGTETAVNSAVGIDDYGATPPSLGGIFIYHLHSSIGGNITLKAQHADTNSDGDFADITGATSGLIDASTAPKSGMVALTTALAIKRYLRWQVVFDVGTSATFTAAFIRNTLP